MATINVSWAVTNPAISIFEEGREIGFYLRKFHLQSRDVQSAVKKACIDQIIYKIGTAWDETDLPGVASTRYFAKFTTACT